MTFDQALVHSGAGTNLRGSVEGANWCFLLPSLSLGRVLSLGSPSPAAMATLSRLGDELWIWAPTEDHERLRAVIADEKLGDVSLLAAHAGALPVPDHELDLVLVAEPRLARSLEPDLRGELQRVLKPTGLVYSESGLGGSRPSERPRQMWIAPAAGEMRFAAAACDRAAIRYLERRFLMPLLRRQLVRRPRRALARTRLASRIARRRAILTTANGDSVPSAAPKYVRTIATRADAEVEGLRWALAAPGDYRSQKVLLLGFGREDDPRAVVKIVRDPSHNFRLENERRALASLRERGIGSERTRPVPLFFGYEAGLAVLGQTALTGTAVPDRTGSRGTWSYGRRVVEWLYELGVATAHAPPHAADATARIEALVERFGDLYRPDESWRRFLANQVAVIAESGNDLRLVFQHGDPGPWNLLITPEGEPAFLDWEAFDPDGLPLWDVFHFLRSFALSTSGQSGKRDPVQSFRKDVLGASEVNRFLVETAGRFCADTGLSPRLLEPLFHLCWVHRAVKEASRLPPDRLDAGRYVGLLGISIGERDSPGLRRLAALATG